MTGTDFCVKKPRMSRSYLNHLVPSEFFHLFLTQMPVCGVVKVICDRAATMLILLKSDQNVKGN